MATWGGMDGGAGERYYYSRMTRARQSSCTESSQRAHVRICAGLLLLYLEQVIELDDKISRGAGLGAGALEEMRGEHGETRGKLQKFLRTCVAWASPQHFNVLRHLIWGKSESFPGRMKWERTVVLSFASITD